MKKKIHYHDTDCGGIVYYANYLKYLEEARYEFFEKLGFSVKKLAEEGVLFVVARQEIDYKSSARYGDEIHIDTWISEVGRVKIWFEYKILNKEGEVLVKARTLMVCVDQNIKKRSIPADIKEKLLKEIKTSA